MNVKARRNAVSFDQLLSRSYRYSEPHSTPRTFPLNIFYSQINIIMQGSGFLGFDTRR